MDTLPAIRDTRCCDDRRRDRVEGVGDVLAGVRYGEAMPALAKAPGDALLECVADLGSDMK
jgi:hypothetical protein